MIRKLALGLVAATVGVGPTWYPHYHRVYMAPPLLVGAPLLAPTQSCMQQRLVKTRKGARWRLVNVCAF